MLIKGNTQLSKSLNPYSTGSNSNLIIVGVCSMQARLNPYSTGSNSNSVTAFQPVCLLVVLILILLEVTQINMALSSAWRNASS